MALGASALTDKAKSASSSPSKQQVARRSRGQEHWHQRLERETSTEGKSEPDKRRRQPHHFGTLTPINALHRHGHEGLQPARTRNSHRHPRQEVGNGKNTQGNNDADHIDSWVSRCSRTGTNRFEPASPNVELSGHGELQGPVRRL